MSGGARFVALAAASAFLFASAWSAQASAQSPEDAFSDVAYEFSRMLAQRFPGEQIYVAPFVDQRFGHVCKLLSEGLQDRLMDALLTHRDDFRLRIDAVEQAPRGAGLRLVGQWRPDGERLRVVLEIGRVGETTNTDESLETIAVARAAAAIGWWSSARPKIARPSRAHSPSPTRPARSTPYFPHAPASRKRSFAIAIGARPS